MLCAGIFHSFVLIILKWHKRAHSVLFFLYNFMVINLSHCLKLSYGKHVQWNLSTLNTHVQCKQVFNLTGSTVLSKKTLISIVCFAISLHVVDP